MAHLAARCTACGTTFRVVPDQLRVADGMVRCGRCSQVFNANESLINLDSFGPPLPLPPPPPVMAAPEASSMPAPTEPAEPAEPAGAGAGVPEPAPAPASQPIGEPGTDFELMLPLGTRASRVAAPSAPESDLPAATTEGPPALQPWSGGGLRFDERSPTREADTPAPSELHAVNEDRRVEPFLEGLDPLRTDAGPAEAPTAQPTDKNPPATVDTVEPAVAGPQAAKAAEAAEAESAPTPAAVPSFMRQADSAQRRRSPRARVLMGAGVAAGLLLLAGQYAFSFRDTLASRNPGMRAVLEPACAALGCRIEAPRLIEQLAVESSGLVRVEKSAVYKLQVALRNRDTIALAMPALDVTLSDAQGKPLARRVMRMSELGVTDTTLAAGRELAVQATLQAALTPASDAVVGYTIELFYP